MAQQKKSKTAEADQLKTDLSDRLAEARAELVSMQDSMRLVWMDPRQIIPHDMNWKTHPSMQRQGFSDLYDEIGWVGALLLNERTGRLLDGHMRLAEALERNEERVPVLVIDKSIEDELKILALLDKIGQMFNSRRSAVEKLAEHISSRSELLKSILEGETDDEKDGDEDEDNPGGLEMPEPLPEGGLSLVLGESYNYIVLLFNHNLDWIAAQDLFDIKPVRCVFNSGVGVGRIVDGSTVLSAMITGTSVADAKKEK